MFINGYLSTITVFAGNFAPRNWNYCQGQLLPISQNTALFSVIGTTFGGDGRTTFGLPDFRGRTSIGTGMGPGLSDRRLGQMGGLEVNYLNTNNLPAHTHPIVSIKGQMAVSEDGGNSASPIGNVPAISDSSERYATSADAIMQKVSKVVPSPIVGSGTGVNNMAPYLVMNYIICVYGIYPSRG